MYYIDVGSILNPITALTFCLSEHMPDSNQSEQFNKNWFNQHAPAPFKTNRRLGVRFVRHDIEVALCKAGMLELAFNTMRKDIPVQLIDISSRGVLISSNLKLNVNKKIILTLRFADDRQFQIPSIIVRKENRGTSLYGIKFEKTNHRLAEYLLITQKVLTFK